MANFTADTALDMHLLDVLGLFDYDFLDFSMTLIRPFDDASNFVKFTGTGFTANAQTGAVTGGTLTGIEFVDLGVPILRVTGATMPAADFYTFATAGNSNDAFTGSSGAGNDTLIGGAGSDTFVFASALTANRDTVRDFAPGVDKLRLDDDIFTALTPGALSADAFVKGSGVTSAQDASDRIVYDTATGALYYDADGAGGAAAVQFAVLAGTPHPALSATDILIVT
jgi:Ca2+-binding RTX toxin-like protein